MVRSGAERLTLADVQAAFDRFSLAHPEIAAVTEIKTGSASWEVPVTSTIRLRLFIQNQIKASAGTSICCSWKKESKKSRKMTDVQNLLITL